MWLGRRSASIANGGDCAPPLPEIEECFAEQVLDDEPLGLFVFGRAATLFSNV